MSQSATAVNEPTYWKKIFIALSALILIMMPLLSSDYGQTGDEWIQIEYGKHIYDYFFNGDKQALDYSNKSFQMSHQEYYGGLYDFPMHMIHRWIPSVDILTLRHFFNALFGALLMLFTGLLARRLSGKWMVGVLALLFMLFSPRIFGEGMNNPKDIPYATGFIIGIYFMVAYLQDLPKKAWRNVIGMIIGWGIAFGVRAAGGILLFGYFVIFMSAYYFLNSSFKEMLMQDKQKQLKRTALQMLVVFIGGYLIGLAFWPWGQQSPIGNPMESLSGMTNREVSIAVLFEGSYVKSVEMPWYYELKWIFISNPIIILLGTVAFIPLIMKAKGKYGLWAVALILFGALFPILYMIYKNSTVYDTWRHVFFVYPFWVIASTLAFDTITDLIKSEKMKLLPYGIAVLGLLPAIIWTVKEHPNQYVYFNELVGGIEGANGVYETEYYQNSGKQAAEWIVENAKPKPNGEETLVRSSLSDFGRYYRDGKDSTWIAGDYGKYDDRHRLNWDYYVTYPRFKSAYKLENGLWPPKNAAYVVEAGGVPLCAVLKRESNASVEAFNAFQAKDYERAAKLYDEYIKVDPEDENVYRFSAVSLVSIGRVDEAIARAEKATQLDPSRPDFFEILYHLYKAKGDAAKAQQAYNKMNAAILAQNGG